MTPSSSHKQRGAEAQVFAARHEKQCKICGNWHSMIMPIMKRLRLLFYSLAFLEIILLTAYEAWGKATLR